MCIFQNIIFYFSCNLIYNIIPYPFNLEMSNKKKDLYELLEIPKTATDDEIRKAYKKAALKYHPDRNRDNPEAANLKFQEINNAYKTLGNPDKRRNYDKFGVIDGEDTTNGGPGMPGMPGGFPFDIFGNIGNIFGGMGVPPGMGQGQRQQQFKSPDKKITINITLADVYNGKSVPIDFTKNAKCDGCDGKGSNRPDGIKICGNCNGQGRIIRMMQMGPIVQQTVHDCNTCAGVGKSIAPGCKCPKCGGNKTIPMKRHVDCYVRPGATPGTTITFKNEADWVVDCSDIGDLIVSVNVSNEMSVYRREGDNLIMKKSISLLESLTETRFRFKHLDNRVIEVKYDKIIHPGQRMIIKNEGMPNMMDNLQRGHLIIVFDVVFPQSLEKDRAKYLVKILPQPNKQIWDMQNDAIPDDQIITAEMESFNDNPTQANKHPSNDYYSTNKNIMDDNNIDDLNDNPDINETFSRLYNGATSGMPECATQ